VRLCILHDFKYSRTSLQGSKTLLLLVREIWRVYEDATIDHESDQVMLDWYVKGLVDAFSLNKETALLLL